MSLTVDAIVGSTGLELKSDPGVPYVYAGFGGAPSGPDRSLRAQPGRRGAPAAAWRHT